MSPFGGGLFLIVVGIILAIFGIPYAWVFVLLGLLACVFGLFFGAGARWRL